MRSIVAGIAWNIAVMQGQALQYSVLPQARHVTGIVVDSAGNPIADARVDYADNRLLAHQTDAHGRFELDTRAPMVVIRKPGYRSELVRTQDAEETRITLQYSPKTRAFPICLNDGPYIGIDGWEATFRFLRVSNVKATRQRHDIDFGARSYYVKTKSGPRGITHGSGPMWSLGMPSDRDVRRSITYEEITYDLDRRIVIDGRGQLPNGQRWRYLGMLGESASYSDVDEATAKELDKFLDGACAKAVSIR